MAVKDRIVICERSTGTWHYHLRRVEGDLCLGGGKLTTLCGEEMHGWDTLIPLEAWGTKDHLPSHWCIECAKKAGVQ